MGFLNKLWDETFAGPTPDSGLGKLRKYNSFSAARSAVPSDKQQVPISRSITVVRNNAAPNRNLRVSVDSPSDTPSPAGSNTPTSPFSPNSPGGNFKKWATSKSTAEPRSPAYDWIVLSGLDR